MGNILNHNRNIFDFDLNKDDYWDFHICLDSTFSDIGDGLVERCLSSYIDISDDECVWFDYIVSKDKYSWEHAVNDGTLVFNSFGFTSVDNGWTHYQKDRITNREFFDMFTKTKLSFDKDDLRLKLYKVNGNNKLYDYSNDIVIYDDKQVAKLNGGFFQGFFNADDGCNYKILPTDLGNGWNFEFVLKREDFANEKKTLNDVYPENKGIFFYIGTRAENKWWIKYLTDHEFTWCQKIPFDNEYVTSDYTDSNGFNDDYFKTLVEVYEKGEFFADDGYLIDDESKGDKCCNKQKEKEKQPHDVCDDYVLDEYYEKDLDIDENAEMKTENGYDLYQPNIKEVKTDNKFLFFDRTCDGILAKDWNEDMELYYHYIEKPDLGNYFLLFHRGCGGYDAESIEKVINVKNKEYNVLNDLYRNALAFQIKDDGTLGYKYLVKDCDSEEENYKIESEFTKKSVIDDEWCVIDVKIKPIMHRNKASLPYLTQNSVAEKMQIYFYVNGKLKMVSKELPILNLKKLNDLNDKQQGVPFNISLGGGTQGLADVVYLNYMKQPEYILPLEKEFAGTFIGYIRLFSFYTCPLNYTEIVKNTHFNKKN